MRTAPRHVSPIALAISQAAEIENITMVSFRLVEPEPDYEEGSLYISLIPLNTGVDWDHQNLVIMDLMIEASLATTFAFTDGSCISSQTQVVPE